MSKNENHATHIGNTNDALTTSIAYPDLLPSFPSHQAVKQFLSKYPSAWNDFLQFPPNIQQELLDFCIGKHGLRITYDPVFRKIFKPETHKDRLESLLSSILNKKVSIMEILPREGTRLSESGSFVIMDVLVRLDDGSYANVEMQKIGYSFPLARTDCYASDIIMRQYEKVKAEQGKNFSFNDLHKVYCIILMEKSPAEFHSVKGKYIHVRTAAFDTGIYKNNAGLHEDIFLCLDTFHSIVHNITKSSTLQDAWLTFLSSDDVNKISSLVRHFPMFLPIYKEITEFAYKPEELMNMLSEALYIMDRNMERLMVEEMKEEVANAKADAKAAIKIAQSEAKAARAEADSAKKEADSAKREADSAKKEANAAKEEAKIFSLHISGKTTEEIADTLNTTLDRVNEVLASANITIQ